MANYFLLFSAVLFKLGVPLGPMPNEDIDTSNLEALEKYRSFTRYFKVAEKESKKPHWWKTYRKHITTEQGICSENREIHLLFSDGKIKSCFESGLIFFKLLAHNLFFLALLLLRT